MCVSNLCLIYCEALRPFFYVVNLSKNSRGVKLSRAGVVVVNRKCEAKQKSASFEAASNYT